ncbi:glycoside hydrolase family 43 protein [Deinococcus sp.]|uniref:glycoside hydrolase family 43 protein n=1 Tax=Deinococcus sp. TaxID=47478 RepID=UPI003CC52A3E
MNILRRSLALLSCFAVLSLQLSSAGGAGSAPSPVKQATYTNPVLNENVPDPFVLPSGGQFYLYVTNGGGYNVPVYVSSDLVHWRVQGDALPEQPSWASPGLTWAPEVMAFGNNRYVLYYTTHDAASGKQCVGAAVATRPAGPYTDRSAHPIVCQAALGGSIDPSPFQDVDGQRYLLWKNDGNCCAQPTRLYIQPLSADGLSLRGTPSALIANDQPWEGAVVEAPTLHRAGGAYYLLYSGGSYNDGSYAVGYATSPHLLGPYRKADPNPLVVTKGAAVGPGHQSVVRDAAGQDWLVYHAWTAGAVGDGYGERSLRIDRITFQGGKIRFGGPTVTPQMAPAGRP